uniref:UL0.5 protein n=1 Tax=Bovine herpesvirus type 1.2 TaxID=79890 RepID=A0A223LKK7_BHV1|nr:UL0.5 protein [Bovine herpesvirus type 1.2]
MRKPPRGCVGRPGSEPPRLWAGGGGLWCGVGAAGGRLVHCVARPRPRTVLMPAFAPRRERSTLLPRGRRNGPRPVHPTSHNCQVFVH